jgi:hypothetical protein
MPFDTDLYYVRAFLYLLLFCPSHNARYNRRRMRPKRLFQTSSFFSSLCAFGKCLVFRTFELIFPLCHVVKNPWKGMLIASLKSRNVSYSFHNHNHTHTRGNIFLCIN